MLFAFLLAVPFTDRFRTLTESQTDVYFAAFLATALSSVFLMTPTAYHRLRWRQYDKEHMLRITNRLAVAGLAILALAIALVVYVVSDVLFSAAPTAIATAAVTGALVLFWFAIPLARRIDDETSRR